MIRASIELVLNGVKLELGDRYFKLNDDLYLADVHFGKTMHFRKAGMPVPMEARASDQSVLMGLLQTYNPKRLIVLGDLFHSVANSEVDELGIITSQFPDTSFVLIKGNHDVMDESVYRSIDFHTVEELAEDGLLLTHEPKEMVPDGYVNIHGHLHPGILLRGKGRQSMIIPCFHLSQQAFCIPAFGALTGLMKVRPIKGDKVYGVVEGEVIELL